MKERIHKLLSTTSREELNILLTYRFLECKQDSFSLVHEVTSSTPHPLETGQRILKHQIMLGWKVVSMAAHCAEINKMIREEVGVFCCI